MIEGRDPVKRERRETQAVERRKSPSIIVVAVAADQEVAVVRRANHQNDEKAAIASQGVGVDRKADLLTDEKAVIIKGDQTRGGGEVDLGATQERETGEATTGAAVGEGGTGGAGEREEGETEDAVDHHLRPGTEVKDHQRGSLRHHQCTSELVVILQTLSHPLRRETSVQ